MKIKFIKPFRLIGNAPDDGSDITVPVGYIVDLENDKSAQWIIDNGFAEEVKKSSPWEPECGETYYYLDSSGCVRTSDWEYTGFDAWRDDIGNVFKTYDVAERYNNYLEAVETVRHDEGFMRKESSGYVSSIVENSDLGATPTAAAFRQHAGEFYFDTYEHAKASLNKHRDEWLTILDYDWSKE